MLEVSALVGGGWVAGRVMTLWVMSLRRMEGVGGRVM